MLTMFAALVLAIEADARPQPARPPEPSPGARTAAPSRIVRISEHRTPLAESDVLAIGFIGGDRLAVLTPNEVVTYRLGDALDFEARRELPPASITVRAPAGKIVTEPEGTAFWAMTNLLPRALLLAPDGARLLLRAEAEALPWPGSPTGLRFREGTNHIEGAPLLFGERTLAALCGAPEPAAVTAIGEVIAGADPAATAKAKAGYAIASVWPGVLVTSAAMTPESERRFPRDTLRFFAVGDHGIDEVDSIALDGSVRALTTLARDGDRALVAAVVLEDNKTFLLRFEISRRP